MNNGTFLQDFSLEYILRGMREVQDMCSVCVCVCMGHLTTRFGAVCVYKSSFVQVGLQRTKHRGQHRAGIVSVCDTGSGHWNNHAPNTGKKRWRESRVEGEM